MKKASGDDRILAELFKILKDAAAKVLHSICQQIWKAQQWPQDWKRSVFIPIPKKIKAKECSNYQAVVLISHTSKIMFKILQARLQQYMKQKRSNCQPLLDHGESKGFPEKHALLLIDSTKSFDCVGIKTNCGKYLKRWGFQTTLPVS